MAISIQDHSKLLASRVVGRFIEDKPVLAGFGGFFPRETTATEYVDIEVERDNDLIAVDVKKFTNGNKNKFDITTEKKFKPPYYREEYDFQRDEVYMNTIALGVGLDNLVVNQKIAQNALKNVRKMRSKIERAILKQQAEVMQTGIVELKGGTSIDFKRKAGSMVDLGSSNYWSESASNPYTDIQAGGRFIRNEGSSGGTILNAVMRTESLNALFANEEFQKQADVRRINRADVSMPQFDQSTGFAFHGQFGAGDFTVNIWTYNEKYTDDQGATKYYLDSNKVVLIPEDFQAKTIFAGIPDMAEMDINGTVGMMPTVRETEYLLRAYSDEKTMSSTLEVSSGPLAMPITIDRIYTMQVLA